MFYSPEGRKNFGGVFFPPEGRKFFLEQKTLPYPKSNKKTLPRANPCMLTTPLHDHTGTT